MNDCEESGMKKKPRIASLLRGMTRATGRLTGHPESDDNTNNSSDVVHHHCCFRERQNDARRDLNSTFCKYFCSKEPFSPSCVVQRLLEFPSLAAEKYGSPSEDFRFFPLSFLIRAGAGLEYVRTAYSIYPEAATTQQGILEDLPLHIACRNGNEAVVRFLIDQNPQTVRVGNKDGNLPLHCLMHGEEYQEAGVHPPLELIQALLDTYPEPDSFGMRTNNGPSNDPLELAFFYGYPPPILNYIIGKFPASIDVLTVTGQCWITLEIAALVSKLLPQLKRIVLYPALWTTDGFLHLMTAMDQTNKCNNDNNRLASIDLKLTGNSLDKSCRRALENVLKVHSNLTDIRVVRDFQHICTVQDDAWFRTVLSAVQCNPKVQEVRLEKFHLTDGKIMEEFFHCNSATLPCLELHDVEWKGSHWGNVAGEATSQSPQPHNNIVSSKVSNHSDTCSSNKLEVLRMENCKLEPDMWQQLVYHLAALPCLRLLTLKSSSTNRQYPIESTRLPRKYNDIDITKPVLHLLTMTRLEYLNVKGTLRVDPIYIADLLETHNTSLQCYQPARLVVNAEDHSHLVAAAAATNNNNRTTTSVNDNRRHNLLNRYAALAKIEHYTRMNEFGRGVVRNTANASIKDVIQLLDKVHHTEPPHQSLMKFNTLHGLLREAPGLWCL